MRTYYKVEKPRAKVRWMLQLWLTWHMARDCPLPSNRQEHGKGKAKGYAFGRKGKGKSYGGYRPYKGFGKSKGYGKYGGKYEGKFWIRWQRLWKRQALLVFLFIASRPKIDFSKAFQTPLHRHQRRGISTPSLPTTTTMLRPL